MKMIDSFPSFTLFWHRLSGPAHTSLLAITVSNGMPVNRDFCPVGRSYFSHFPEGKAAQGHGGQ